MNLQHTSKYKHAHKTENKIKTTYLEQIIRNDRQSAGIVCMVFDVGVVAEDISKDVQEEVQRILVEEVYLVEGIQGEVDTRTCLKVY